MGHSTWAGSIANADTKTFFFHKANLEAIVREADIIHNPQANSPSNKLKLTTGAEAKYFPEQCEYST